MLKDTTDKNGSDSRQNRSENNGNSKNWLEWTVFVIGSVITFSVFVYLIYAVIIYKPTDPDLYVDYVISQKKNDSHRLQLVVRNTGLQTAEHVKVSASLLRNDEELERGEIMIEYVPKRSERTGWVIFEHKIRNTDSISINIQSYLSP